MRGIYAVISLMLLVITATSAMSAQSMTRSHKELPAIVLTAFGTSTKAKVTYDALDSQVKEALPGYEVRWAFTSEVIREIVNRRREKEGSPERLLSLQQVLANLQAEGYTRAAVQPLHIFPGEEYEEVLSITESFPGITVLTGETLLQRWEMMHEVVAAISTDFLTPDEGCNVVVSHGTPTTNTASNMAYMGLDRYLKVKYDNVFLGGVEGVITREEALGAAKGCVPKRVRFIPLMYVAGDHIMNDIAGEVTVDELPWSAELEEAGITTDTTTVDFGGKTFYKGLGFFPEVNKIFIDGIKKTLDRL